MQKGRGEEGTSEEVDRILQILIRAYEANECIFTNSALFSIKLKVQTGAARILVDGSENVPKN